MRPSYSILCSTLVFAAVAHAQAAAGQSVATVLNGSSSTAGAFGEMFVLDHQARTATKLTLSAALSADRPNCVLMTSGAAGFVGTNPFPANTPGNLYAITIAQGAVAETKLNTTATAGGNVAQIVALGGSLYFTTQNATGTGGFLQSVPAGGGAVTSLVDLTTISTPTAWTGLANAICAVGTNLYIAGFDSGATAVTGCIAVWDTVAGTGSILLQLPKGKYVSGTSTFNTGIVHMHTAGGMLHALGVYGDYLVIDPATGLVVSHDFAGFGTATAGATNLVNSFDLDASTGDLIVGSRDGACDRIASGESAEKVIPGVGTNTTATLNSVNGMSHVPAATLATDVSYGAGCAGAGGYTLTDVASGLPSAGNAGYQLGAYSGNGGDAVACLIHAAPSPPIDLTSIGMTGCFLHIPGVIVSVGGVLGGAGAGAGKIQIPLPIPATAAGGVIYRQWAEISPGVNPAGIVASNARKMSVL